MINKGKQRFKNLSIFLVFMLLIGQSMPSLAFANTDKEDKEQNASHAIIQSDLQEAFDEETFVSYIVVLEDQVDTDKVAHKIEAKAQKEDLSDATMKEKKQEAVVSSLIEKAEVTQADLSAYLKQATKDNDVKEFRDFYIVNGFSVEGNQESVEEIAQYPEVKSILLDGEKKLVPPEEKRSEDGQTISADEEVEWNVDRMEAPVVWDRGFDGEGIVVANIDSGVDWAHPALKEKYRGYDPENPDEPDNEFNWHDAASNIDIPVDSDGHGTHTMGTMVGQESDGTNKVGVAPGAQWITARAFNGDTANDSDILDAAEWLLAPTDKAGNAHPEKAPDIINNSWGGNPIDNDWFRPMVQSWESAGIVPIFSAGNTTLFMDADPGTVSSPGNYPESIAVGATDEDDKLAEFSLRGPTEDGDIKPDVSAPGVNIRSSVPGESWDEFEYDEYNGTSMAAPAVAGTVALMKQADGSLSVEAIADLLKVYAEPRTDEEYSDSPNNGYGYGQVNANTVMEAVEEGIGTIDGQVVGEGSDNEDPTFDFEPIETLYEGEEAYFSIHVADNISVNHVTLILTNREGVEETFDAERVEGDHLDGSYQVVVPPESVNGDSMDYQWVTEDFTGNTIESDVYTADVKEGVTDGYKEDFESNPDGWYSFGTFDTWEWGKPVYGPEKAASGEKVMGTNLDGNYNMSADMTLVMPPVFPEEGTKLQFSQWYELAPFGWDVGTVYVSTDKENWEELLEIQDENTNWHEAGIDLSDYAGERVYIGFNLTSLDNENPGWYIDDVKLVNENTSDADNVENGEREVTLSDDEKAFPQAHIQESDSLPLDATIEVEETGWETKADPQNGEFSIYHKPGDYTLRIDAYGYEPVTEKVSLSSSGTVSPEINMEAMPKQLISGTITDHFGNGVKDASIFLLEDEHVTPVNTTPDGTYELDALEGEYTLQVYAKGFYKGTKSVTVELGEDIDLDMELEPFYASDDTEVKYDNGSYEKNLAMGKKGNGFAVKMSLDEDEDLALLTGAKLQFWAEHVPIPGGDDIVISVYDATGEDGAPGNKIAGPFDEKAERDLNKWTNVDLADEGIIVDDDFYILYTQYADYPYIPGFVADGDVDNYEGRSWDYFGGQWFETDGSAGNYMIRALVDYGEEAPDLAKPVINTPDDGELTNEEYIDVTGNATPDSQVQLTNNGENLEKVEADSDGRFSADVTLSEGANELQAVAISEGSPVSASDAVTITLDTEEPEISIDSPEDGQTVREDTITVKGTVSDKHLDWIRVNEDDVEYKDGAFETEITLDEGENEIKVEAMDEVGNNSAETITVTYEEEDDKEPTIDNIEPTTDQTVFAGDEVTVSFESNVENGDASFQVVMPAASQTNDSAVELPMEEGEPGVYEGTWDVPKSLHVEGAVIQVQVTGEDGTHVKDEAEGKLYVFKNTVDRIAGDIRYDTAIEISEEGWDESDTVILARGKEYADSLAGVPLAHKLDAPILLTPTDELWERTMDEIERLNTSNVIILGGPDAVDKSVEDTLKEKGLDVERIAGKDRFRTAEKIADRVTPFTTEKVAIANGMDFPDALSVASHAAKEGIPILLTKSDWMADSTVNTIKSLGVEESIAVGGQEVIGDNVLEQLPDATRLSGHDRYDTNIAVNEYFDADSDVMYVATGEEYADALTGAVLTAKNDSTILLVHRRVPDVVKDYIEDKKVKRLSVFGGDQAVSKEVFQSLKDILP